MDLLCSSSMPASLVTRFFANGAKIPATGLIDVSPSYMFSPYSLIAFMSPLSRFFFLLPFPTFIRSGCGT